MSSPLHSSSSKNETKTGQLENDNDSRYSKRFKTLVTDTPPRDPERIVPRTPERNTLKTPERNVLKTPERNSARTPEKISTNYPSPLRRNNNHHDRYKTVELRNEDLGEWREKSTSHEIQVNVEEKVVAQVEKTENTEKLEKTEKKDSKESSPERKKSRASRIPHYMQGTRSFESKLNSRKDDQKHRNTLGPRSGGGITKRVGTSKIPKYKSTTSINAVEDIKNEMASEDAYISMAARIKLFERGLGNASNKIPVPPLKESRPSSKLSTRNPEPMTSTLVRRSKSTQEYPDSNVPNYARATESTVNRSNELNSSQEKESKPKKEPRKEVKPFRFATSERAQRHQETFNEKLKLWRMKEEKNRESETKFGVKRKSDNELPTQSKRRRE